MFDVKITNSKWVINKYAEKIRIDLKLKLKSLQQTIKANFNIDVSRMMCYRATKKAMNEIHGYIIEQYARLWDYAEELKRSNMRKMMKMQLKRE